jgi:hypothetical protein
MFSAKQRGLVPKIGKAGACFSRDWKRLGSWIPRLGRNSGQKSAVSGQRSKAWKFLNLESRQTGTENFPFPLA